MPQDTNPHVAAELLRNARWMAGLTQAEVANRAGVARQVVSAYETGTRQPCVDTLDQLLRGCGVRLRLALVPEPGLEDEPTLELLSRPPFARLAAVDASAIRRLAEAAADEDSLVIGGKTAARLHGARVRTEHVEMWTARELGPTRVADWLSAARLADSDGSPLPTNYEPSAYDLREGAFFACGESTVEIRAKDHFEGILDRSALICLAADDSDAACTASFVRLAHPDDCALGWHPRDRDHLALQRVVRLIREGTANPSVHTIKESRWAAHDSFPAG